MMKGYCAAEERLLVRIIKVSVSPAKGGLVRLVEGYHRISHKPGYLVEGSVW